MVRGQYGEFKVLLDGDTVIDGGAAAFLGVLPTRKQIWAAIGPACLRELPFVVIVPIG